jgi:hypothetical protein
MQLEFLIPITLFGAIAYSIKAVVDSRVRRQLVQSNVSQELVQSIIQGDEVRRRHSSLRWGVVLIALAIGFGFIDVAGWDDITPGSIAILLGATGLGNLAHFLIARRLGG